MQLYGPSIRNPTCDSGAALCNQLSYYKFSPNSSIVISEFPQYKVTPSMRAGVFIAAVVCIRFLALVIQQYIAHALTLLQLIHFTIHLNKHKVRVVSFLIHTE